MLFLPPPLSGDHKQKFYWGHKEILIPVYKNMSEAMKKHPDVDVLISFASLRSAFDSTMETMQHPQVRSTATRGGSAGGAGAQRRRLRSRFAPSPSLLRESRKLSPGRSSRLPMKRA